MLSRNRGSRQEIEGFVLAIGVNLRLRPGTVLHLSSFEMGSVYHHFGCEVTVLDTAITEVFDYKEG